MQRRIVAVTRSTRSSCGAAASGAPDSTKKIRLTACGTAAPGPAAPGPAAPGPGAVTLDGRDRWRLVRRGTRVAGRSATCGAARRHSRLRPGCLPPLAATKLLRPWFPLMFLSKLAKAAVPATAGRLVEACRRPDSSPGVTLPGGQ